MEKTGFWTRVGQWFKSVNAMGGDADLGGSPLDPDSGLDSNDGQHEGVRAPVTVPARRMHRASGLERLEEEYARIVNLMDRVQKHMEEQGERSQRMADSLDRLNETLASLPQATAEQSQLLARMDQRLASEAASLRKLEDELCQLPALADAQREAMVSIHRQLEASRDGSQKLNATLGEFRDGLGRLTEATGATGRALEKVSGEAVAREDRLARILELQGKRFTVFAIAAIAAAVLAAGAAVAAILIG